MPDMIDLDVWRIRYREAVQEILPFVTPEVQDLMARHQCAWGAGRFDFGEYLQRSEIRFAEAIKLMNIRTDAAHELIDVGGFWGAFPLSLVRCGCHASMTEAMQYYDSSFSPLFDWLQSEGVDIIDFDPFATPESDDWRAPPVKKYRVATVMAVLEHYPHSLKTFFHNLRDLIRSGDGHACIEVPNIAYWSHRIDLLMGRSPLPSAVDIHDSATPFLGHHHEYTATEFASLLDHVDFTLDAMRTFNYSSALSWKSWILSPIRTAVLSLVPSARETMLFAATPQNLKSLPT